MRTEAAGSPRTPPSTRPGGHSSAWCSKKPAGGWVRVELLRSLDWIEDYGADFAGMVHLDMPEMGVEGLAEVLAIERPVQKPDAE